MSAMYEDVRKRIYEILAGGLSAVAMVDGSSKNVPVYDRVPPSATFPYVRLGADNYRRWDGRGMDGAEMEITIHTWQNDTATRSDVMRIMERVRDLLHRREGKFGGTYRMARIACEYEETLHSPDVAGDKSRYFHGVQLFKLSIHRV